MFHFTMPVIPAFAGMTGMKQNEFHCNSLLSCNDFPAELAELYGYINRALPTDELTLFVEKLARRIASFSAHTIVHAKAAVDRGISVPCRRGFWWKPMRPI